MSGRNVVLWGVALSLAGLAGVSAEVQTPGGVGTPLAASTTAKADAATLLKVLPTDRVEGQAAAPVTIIEYASMTCPHCKDFTSETLPKVEEEWVNTGKAKYVLRHLPWDNLGLAEALVMYCAPASSYYPLAKAFFGAQEAIAGAPDPLAEVKQIARFAGLDDAAVQKCVTDQAGHDFITTMKTQAQHDLAVDGTPTFFINGTRVDGAVPYDKILPVLKAAYAKAGGK
jgi:protein-disulfide isomerase